MAPRFGIGIIYKASNEAVSLTSRTEWSGTCLLLKKVFILILYFYFLYIYIYINLAFHQNSFTAAGLYPVVLKEVYQIKWPLEVLVSVVWGVFFCQNSFMVGTIVTHSSRSLSSCTGRGITNQAALGDIGFSCMRRYIDHNTFIDGTSVTCSRPYLQ